MIGESAFACCENLKKVSVPESLKVIEREAFLFCHEMEQFYLPKDFKKIGKHSFSKCLKLEKIWIHNIEQYAYDAFLDCFAKVWFNGNWYEGHSDIDALARDIGMVAEIFTDD